MPNTFQREKAQECFAEALPLLQEHWKEVETHLDIPVDPDFAEYEMAENAGRVATFTARDESGKLIGYAVFFLRNNLHYKTSLQACQDLLFISREHRGMNGEFISYCDDQLRALGVQIVYQPIKVAHNFGPLLEKLGYSLTDLIFSRRFF